MHMQMMYQSTVDATELCDNLSNKKSPLWQCVRSMSLNIICRAFFKNPQFFFLALEISFWASVSVLLFVDHHLG